MDPTQSPPPQENPSLVQPQAQEPPTVVQPPSAPSPQSVQPQTTQPQTTPSQVHYASFLRRFGALLVDSLLLSTVNMVIFMMFGASSYFLGVASPTGPDPAQAASMFFLFFVQMLLVVGITIAYGVGFLALRGATPGKMVLGLVVVDAKLGKLSFGTALLRETIGKFVSSIALGVGYLWVIWDEKKQGWHDKIAGTLVIEKR